MIKDEKKRLREEMISIRNNMKPSEVYTLSSKIISTLVDMPEYKCSRNIMLYLSFKNEVDTFKLISYSQKYGKNVIVPFTIKERKEIIPTILKDVDSELTESYYGYLEPKKEYLRPIDKSQIDLIIVPGVVFDKHCYRIGFGGGYYDRFLSDIYTKVTTIGIAYDFQIKDKIPTEEFDIPLDYVITEKRIIKKM